MGVEVVGLRASVLMAVSLSVVALGSAVFAGDVTVGYLGHSCFTIQAEEGPVVMLDPYGSYVPYPGLPVPADIVLMTHGHVDHCPDCFGERNRVEGDPIKVFLLDSDGRCKEKLPPASWAIAPGFETHAIEGTHRTAGGGGQGRVCMFSFEIDGIRFAHLGDLGSILTADRIGALGNVDVLFLPIGGAFTLNAAEAMTVIAQLPSVKVVFPTHYYVEGRTPTSWSAMAPLGDFTLLAATAHTVRQIDDFKVVLNADTLPRSVEVWVLEYKSD
jgi:L-ascorbate metabolism protein UlaG (beta-lactamase superfamily)